MVNLEQIDRLKSRIEGETYSDGLLNELLISAKDIIFSLRYPYTDSIWPSELDSKDLTNQIDIAVWMLDKLGAEGQIAHSENGINRSWDSGDLPVELASRFVAKVGLI